ncbi:bifunctional phosphopantothenoylcysteine decarboxylase/phosphopantothenate--cysteine ligase CoaBC [Solirubrobacter sp. CPCC 204708]|uniref:Coenzyme A biosynthesis bifunctional protein CoaBC n=1 Tax=Solirubrobacter deserti TaxID=2282478 RepID=A0ABT4RGV5_9ACTN|nr:bifunctional phosphopantothenoylcysteine decarboxylase/phosphopantothenate--cysteine ligase CoaBC [Solirubrobacter deserti]MBE2315381.1 bifunctional phosphopantothenoylcysteine decarboxylase/phosphopantothenate--cysteine ligase CoaBC [Solirubrobacter deserti]MDA0137775.1 bifunctional phosphopantothenoylcysteine decarboxylase/phosphopantothenate--cysteine ligase CoaBC [Solirubrobacter deserti]
MPRILLGVCGGIAAYKALEFTRLATKAGHSVRVVQTEASTRFVGTASFAGITGAPVLITEWEPDPLRGVFPGDPLPEHAPLSHLALVEHADAYLIAPATAETLAKLACGLADNLLTAAALACRRPLIVAPAMNNAMYEHPATQANLATLRARGVTVLEPGVGPLGSPGEFGVGRLPEPPELLAAVETTFDASLRGVNVLVSAGGTREPIDAVRFIGNRSSGRMGFAVAEQAQRRGANVTVVAANVSLPRATGIEYVDVVTAAELADACAARFDACDVLIMAAAVADYRPEAAHGGKLKKDQTGEELNLRLVRTTDVLSSLADRRRPGQTIVGFAAEHGDGALAYGRGKLERKHLDAVVVNDVSGAGIGFDAADNEVWIVTAEGEHHVPKTSKDAVAAAILDAVLNHSSSNDTKVR